MKSFYLFNSLLLQMYPRSLTTFYISDDATIAESYSTIAVLSFKKIRTFYTLLFCKNKLYAYGTCATAHSIDIKSYVFHNSFISVSIFIEFRYQISVYVIFFSAIHLFFFPEQVLKMKIICFTFDQYLLF